MANKVQFGLSNIKLFPITKDDKDGTTYGELIDLPGAVTLSLDSEENEGKFHADNILYYSSFKSSGYTGSVEIARIPANILTEIFGQTKDATTGALVEKADDQVKQFGMAFQIEGDESPTVYQLMKVSCGKPSVKSNTITDSAEPVTAELKISASPRMSDQAIKAIFEKEATGYATALTKIMEKANA